MVKKFTTLSFRMLLAFSLCVVLAVQLAGDMDRYYRYRLSCDNTAVWSAEDFEQYSLQLRDDFYIATDSDSQMVMVVDAVMGGMEFEMDTYLPTGEILVYYTTAPDQNYTEAQRTWAVPVEENGTLYTFTIPVQYVYRLRIDPTIYGGNRLIFGSFYLNPQRSLADYAGLTVTEIPVILARAGFLTAFLKFVQEIFTKYRDKVYKKK